MKNTPIPTQNKVFFLYKNHSITQDKFGDEVVYNETGDGFYICLDDSKTHGYRKSVEMSFKKQIESSFEYIDWITNNHNNRN
jgi:hypothetical protein